MSDDNNNEISTEDARAGSTHDRSWLAIGLIVAAVIVVIGAFLI